MIYRRSLITGLISFVAAPAIVRASSLMPIKAIPQATWRMVHGGITLERLTAQEWTVILKYQVPWQMQWSEVTKQLIGTEMSITDA